MSVLIALVKLPFLKIRAWWSMKKTVKAIDKATSAINELLKEEGMKK